MDKTFILSLISPFFLGILAGSTTCSCLIGGILVSVSKSWSSFKSHLFFNLSRLISFSILGIVLGLIGNFFNLFSSLFPIIITVVSIFMIYLALPMIGINIPQISFFKFNHKKKYSPALFGILTPLIPCGFTLAVESLAVISASPIKGFLIMLVFILGTIPSLLLIGFFSFKFYSYPRLSKTFSFIAGLFIIIYSVFTLKSQFFRLPQTLAADTLIVADKQIIKMTVLDSSYQPNYFKVKTNMPIIWEINNKSYNNCTSGLIISPLFFKNPIRLSPNQVTTKEFTIINPGTYHFSCSMGMVAGVIEASN
jgi:sulfite exporter TauE/SafE